MKIGTTNFKIENVLYYYVSHLRDRLFIVFNDDRIFYYGQYENPSFIKNTFYLDKNEIDIAIEKLDYYLGK